MLNRPEDALAHFDLALAVNDAYAEAHLNRGIVLNELGRHEEVQSAFERASELDRRDSKTFPSDVGNRLAITHAQLGDLYLLAEHPEEAAEHYETALGIRPRFLDIRTKFSEALIALGPVEQAISELEFILEAKPSFVGARVRLGVVFNRTGNTAGAIREWQQCLVDDPDDMRARAYLASLGVMFPHAHGADAEKDAA
jgi:protein O-GlcNAc transferase